MFGNRVTTLVLSIMLRNAGNILDFVEVFLAAIFPKYLATHLCTANIKIMTDESARRFHEIRILLGLI